MKIRSTEDGIITIDGKPFIKNIGINIPNKNQCRAKWIYIDDNGIDIPLDFVVYDMEVTRKSINGIHLKIIGQEKCNSVNFTFAVNFNLKIISGIKLECEIVSNINKTTKYYTVTDIKTFLSVAEKIKNQLKGE